MSIDNDTSIYEPPFTGDYHYYNFEPGGTAFDALSAGGTYTDPIFDTTVKRLTVDVAQQTGQDLYGHNFVSLNGKYFFHKDSSGVQHVRLMSNGSSVETGIPRGTVGAKQWSPIDEETFYYVSGSGIYYWTVGDGSGTLVHSFGATLADAGGSLNFTDRTARFFIAEIDGGNCKVYDSVDDAEYTGTTISSPGGGHASLSPDGAYVFWVSGGAYYAYPLNHTTNTVGAATEFWAETSGDHSVFITASNGNSYMFRADGDIDGYFYAVDIRDRSGLTKAQQREDTGVVRVFPSYFRYNFHASAVFVGDNKDWIFVSTEDNADDFDSYESGGLWAAYENEIIAVNLLNVINDSGTKFKRLCHHRSKSANSGPYDWQPRACCAPDGSAVIWTSNYNSNAYSGGAGYADIWGVESPLGAAASPSSTTSGKGVSFSYFR